MTENAVETAATDATIEQETAPAKPKPTETVDFWKQKAREQETRAKANADAATRLQQIEDAQKSAEERTTEALSAAERRAQDAESRALRLEIAAEKGLTPAQAKRLIGSSREELETDADDLLATFKPASDKAAEAVAVDLDLGARGTSTTSDQDAAKWLQSITRH